MKIKDILKEDVASPEERLNEIRHMLLSNSHQFLKKCIASEIIFDHRSRRNNVAVSRIVDNVSGRFPSDTPTEIHHALDLALEKKFGHKFRSNALFAWASAVDHRAQEVNGDHYMVFPIGEYKIINSPEVRDFYLYYDSIMFRQFLESPMAFDALDPTIVKKYEISKEFVRDVLDKHLSLSWAEELSSGSRSFDKMVFALTGESDGTKGTEIRRKIQWNLITGYEKFAKNAIERLVDETYHEVADFKEFKKSRGFRHEVMIHADKFVMLNVGELVDIYNQLHEDRPTILSLLKMLTKLQ